jgi:hypothetical protein
LLRGCPVPSPAVTATKNFSSMPGGQHEGLVSHQF